MVEYFVNFKMKFKIMFESLNLLQRKPKKGERDKLCSCIQYIFV